MKYTEGGRLAGDVLGGGMGAAGGYALCNMFFGLETAGTSLLWCALASGGAGAYAGGKAEGAVMENVGEQFYELTSK